VFGLRVRILATFCFVPVVLSAACDRSRAERRQVSSPLVSPSASNAALAAVSPSAIQPLAGPLRVRCSDTDDCLESELAFYGDASSRVVESVWARVKLRPSDRAARFGLEPLLVPLPFPAATRLLEVELVEGSVFVLLESVAALGQPAGLRAVVQVPAEPVVLARSVQGFDVRVQADETRSGSANPWTNVSAREPLNEEALLALTKLAPAAMVEPEGLSVERTWQGVFRERKQLIAPERLAHWPELSTLQRRLSTLRSALAEGQVYRLCPDLLNRFFCEDAEGNGLWFENVGGRLRLSASSRAAAVPTPASAPSTDGEQALDQQIARLPLTTKVVWRGLWSGSVPIAVLAAERPLRAFVAFGGNVAALRSIDAVNDASFERPSGRLDAGLWDRLGNRREELVLRLERPGAEPWIGVYALDPLAPRPSERGSDSSLAFWAHDAKSVGDAIAALEHIPQRGIPRGVALGLLKASQTARGFRANAAANATVFEMSGWYDTGGAAPLRKDEKQRDELSDAKVQWLGTLGDWQQSSACPTFECAKNVPYCYCSAHSSGIADHFWFEQRAGRWLISGVGRAGTD